MKTTSLEKPKELWQLIKEAAKNMWKWFTAAPESLQNNFDSILDEEPDVRQLINQTDIEGTPFRLTGHPAKGYWIQMGPYRLTLQKPTKKEALEDLEKEHWNIIARFIAITHDFEKNIKPNLDAGKTNVREH